MTTMHEFSKRYENCLCSIRRPAASCVWWKTSWKPCTKATGEKLYWLLRLIRQPFPFTNSWLRHTKPVEVLKCDCIWNR